MALDPKKATKDDIARGLELLEKENVRKAKIASGEIKGGVKWSEMTEEQKGKARLQTKKRNVRIKLERARFAEAVAAGKAEAVTDAEIAAEMAA